MIKRGSVICAFLAVASLAACRQSYESPPTGKAPTATTATAETARLEQKMNECADHCASTVNSIDDTTKAIDDAKQTNDPAAISAALDRARNELSKVRSHVNACKEMRADVMRTEPTPGGA